MSSGSPRWVVVDDTDTDIAYTGPWFQDQGSQDSVGNFGPTYKSTLHGANDNASLSFSFSGSSVRVYGTNSLRNDSGVLDPSWECFIDHISIGATTPFQFPENNWVFCEQDTLVDGPHTITVNATVRQKQTFWFDQIQYVPSASVPLGPEAILVDSHDPALQFGDGWGALGGTANSTGQTGSTFTFDFIGVSLSWFGFIPTELPHAATTASYSVDGQPAVNFLLKGLPETSGTVYNQKFFETQTYPAGPHKITVLYQGSGSTTPLVLDYLVVQNGTVAGSGTSTAGSGSPTSAGSNTNNGGGDTPKSTNIGAIVGGIIGALLFIILGLLIFIFWRRREKKRRLSLNEMNEKPFDEAPGALEPFNYDPAHSTTVIPNHGPDYQSYLGSYPSYMGSYPSSDPIYTTGARSGPTQHGSMPSFGASEMQSSVMAPPSSSAYTAGTNLNATTGHLPAATGDAAVDQLGMTQNPGYVPYQPMPTKLQREADATAAAAAMRQQQRDGMPSPPLSDFSSSSGSRLVVHEDSGIRMPTRGNSVVEVPPRYTPG